jgi:Tol biopolymer transport system component/DNA-binding winged helix-turn-helix (wHTH) protein
MFRRGRDDHRNQEAILENLMMSRFRLEGRMVDPSLNRVTHRDETTQVEPKIMQVLIELADHHGQLVTRDDLMARVWSGVFVTDDALNRAIRELRRLFDDDADTPRVIETIRKRGYRLIAPIQLTDPQEVRQIPLRHDRSAPVGARDRVSGLAWMAMVLVIAILSAGAVVRFGIGRRPSAEAHVRFVPLTTEPGNEVAPALSPSGRLAYVAGAADGRSHLFAKRPPDMSAVQITHGDAREAAPAWSPDDRHLAFARLRADTCDIWILDVEAGDERRIAPCATRRSLQMSWAPDGTSLALTAGAHRLTAPSRIDQLNIATGTAHPVTAPPPGVVGDESPAFSPDGHSIAFVRSISGSIGDVFIAPVAGGEPRRITMDNADVLGLDWDSDGEHVVFASERGGGISVWRVAASGGEPSLVAGGGAKLKHPSVARRTGVIAYEDWRYEINIVDLPTSHQGNDSPPGVRVSPTSDQWNFDPQISPDRSRIVFQSTRSGQYELWVANRHGGGARQLTQSSTFKSFPRWSPDSRHVAYASRSPEGAELSIIDVDTGAVRSVATDPTSIVAPAWSHDGRRVYYGSRRSGDWQTWSVHVDGAGVPEAITTDGGYAAMESVDGRWLYTLRLDRRGLWRRPTAGGPETLVTDVIDAEDWANVAVADHALFFITRPDDGDPQLAALEDTSNALRLLTRLPDFAWSGLAVSSDGARVLYAHADHRDSNIVGMLRRP